ncbi:MAG: Rrf2 family transcriptional regulator [Actinobacteria bacterium]|nr:Rrf2 family transcriptional regulator [Actinomycetota bacterium]
MKLITRDTDYAVRALCFIAKNKGQNVSVTKIVEELGIPRPFLRKILQVLHQNGILKSSKGFGGGFTLEMAPEKIYLVDLIEIFQGSVKINECLFKKRVCHRIQNCKLRKQLDEIQEYVISKLKNVTLASLLD